MTIRSANLGNLNVYQIINGSAAITSALLHIQANDTLYTWTPYAGTVAIIEGTGLDHSILSIVSNNIGHSSIWFGDTDNQNKGRLRYEHSTDSMEFWTNGAQRVHIEASGNVGIGIPAGATANLSIKGSANNRVLDAYSTTDKLMWQFNTLSSQPYLNLYKADGTTIGTKIAAGGWDSYFDGNVGIGATSPGYQLHLSTDDAGKPNGGSWTNSSDIRLKENIVTASLDRCYEIVKNLPLKRYTWKDSTYTIKQSRDRSMLGWMAQDVQSVFPKAVNSGSFTTLVQSGSRMVRDVNAGSEVIDDCLNLNGTQIMRSLYGAVQKLQLKVEALEAQINGSS